MSYGLLEHFEAAPLAQLLDETIRVLKPGGLFVADIVPSTKRLNARSLGLAASFAASCVVHFLTGKWDRLSGLRGRYFEHYFENTFDNRQWADILRQHGLEAVRVDVCWPFPPLALAGAAERAYTAIMRRLLPIQRRFDGANNAITSRWGWMYLSYGMKPGGRAE